MDTKIYIRDNLYYNGKYTLTLINLTVITFLAQNHKVDRALVMNRSMIHAKGGASCLPLSADGGRHTST